MMMVKPILQMQKVRTGGGGEFLGARGELTVERGFDTWTV